MLQKPIRETHDFLLSNYFSEGLRITFGVLMPSLIMAHFGMLQQGISLSLGALCVSIVDSPGPIHHRKNAMLITIALISIVSILIGLTNKNNYFVALMIFGLSFVFSMLYLYGNRASAIGTSALLIMVLGIDDVRPWKDVLYFGLYIFAGGLWYAILSYSIYRLRPYRLAQQTLSESVYEIAKFLKIKAKFYNLDSNFEEIYKELLEIQITVHHKQDEVREVLFKTRSFLRDSSPYSRFLLVLFTDMVDLFEQIMSTYYSYKNLHQQFDKTGVLNQYHKTILLIAEQLEEIAFALKTGKSPLVLEQLDTEFIILKAELKNLENNKSVEYQLSGINALSNISSNIENIINKLKDIKSYFNKSKQKKLKPNEIDLTKFIDSQDINIKLFFDNLSFDSSNFRHALRVSVAMLIGFVISRYLNSTHSYWTLLTILVISKPGFSLTKERNYHRIIGTIVGALIGAAIIHFIKDKNALFIILILFMIASYSFQRINYVVSVLFMTPFILIVFDFLGMGTIAIAQERILNTLIGSFIALTASYFLFPSWEHKNLKEAMIKMIIANRDYFNEIRKKYTQHSTDTVSYKLARKNVFVNSSNLASIFQRMLSEPKDKQLHIKELHQFTVLNHLLSSHIASLYLFSQELESNTLDFSELDKLSNNCLKLFDQSKLCIENQDLEVDETKIIKFDNKVYEELSEEKKRIADQFILVQKMAFDILKICRKFNTNSSLYA